MFQPVICAPDVINSFRESITINFDYNGVPLTVSCRLLEYGLTDRRERQYYDHPHPPFSRIFIFETGGADISTVNGNFTLESGRIYLLPSARQFQSSYYVSRLIYFHLHICDASERSLFDGTAGIPSLNDAELFNRFLAAFTTGDKFALLCCLMDAIRFFLRPHMAEMAKTAVSLQKFSKLFDALHNNLPAASSLKVLAEIYNVSPNSFSKRFQRTMSMPLKKYLIGYQILQAQKLLLYSNYTIAKIAEMLGYTSSQYFHRFFRKHCLLSPAEYRRRNNVKVTAGTERDVRVQYHSL